MENWLNATPDSPEALILTTIIKALQVMPDRDNFAGLAADFIISNSEGLSDLEKNAIDAAARSIYVLDSYTLAQGLNAILTQPWSAFGVRYMPEGAAITPEQRLGFIQGIYGYAALRIAQHLEEMQTLLSVPYQHPTIPAAE